MKKRAVKKTATKENYKSKKLSKYLIWALLLIILAFGIFFIFQLNKFEDSLKEMPPPAETRIQGEINPATGRPLEPEKLQNITEKLTDKEKRDYLFKEWETLLSKNKYLAPIDAFLKKMSFVFLILFGEPYSLSGILLMIIILWFYFFLKFSEILRDFSPLSSWVSIIIGLAIVFIMAHSGIFRSIAEFFVWLAFYKDYFWWKFAIFIGIVLVLITIYKISSQFGKSLKEQRKKDKEEMERAELAAAARVAEGVMRGAADDEGLTGEI